MIKEEIELYKELVDFCNSHKSDIETKFDRTIKFDDFNALCYEKIFFDNRNTEVPPSPKELKDIIPGLAEAYKKWSPYYMNPRNKYKKGLDIQLGQWYEKALQMFFQTKGIIVTKKGYPFPDFEVSFNRKVVGYYELKFIESPFLSANSKIKDTYPYTSTRYDYEASLTLDTGEKMRKQRAKMEELIETGYPVHFLWWFDCFHIKGIFGMSAKDVYSYFDNLSGNQLERKTRDGDKLDHQEIGKIYPPLLNMITFYEYINFISK